jgi:hypothetical protein
MSAGRTAIPCATCECDDVLLAARRQVRRYVCLLLLLLLVVLLVLGTGRYALHGALCDVIFLMRPARRLD